MAWSGVTVSSAACPHSLEHSFVAWHAYAAMLYLYEHVERRIVDSQANIRNCPQAPMLSVLSARSNA
jgi:hypothetical protein